jgi:hypothetical protein
MKVRIELKETSQPIVREAVNTYTKGPFYCIDDGSSVEKYPLANIWRVTETCTAAAKGPEHG